MKCKKCDSENLGIVKSGPHNKLVCKDCLTFQKFLNAADAKTFNQLHAQGTFSKAIEGCTNPKDRKEAIVLWLKTNCKEE